ncbi:MAG: bifunctional phosphoribosylaminoimidazolecarboxamide formyltransferase/IMP cyclohydrolase, partial [Phycisphaerales bacterium]|nr:bifunctional phosphoribosylaminoimidazolecarboxamide formyltransferase/IMP cyclohydrolase [Phycisphaerales bacterium]
TLHPKVHGGILARRDLADHVSAMETHGIGPIDLVCINLYPFEETVARPGVTRAEAIEQIDIGGPAMVRSAAKNHAFVTVVTDVAQYARVLADLDAHGGGTSEALRRDLARAAFARTSAYDREIAAYLAGDSDEGAVLDLRLERVEVLRYGENPHQGAGVYRIPGTPAGLVGAEQLHGKGLSFNNLNDAAGAWRLVCDLLRFDGDRAGAAVIKHTNPCGAALAPDVASAVSAAIAGDPLAAYGGILAANVVIDGAAAERIAAPDRFFEVVLAPGYAPEALAVLRERWKNVRLLQVDPARSGEVCSVRTIPGGALVQEVDAAVPVVASWVHAAGPSADAERLTSAGAVWLFAKHLTSNAIAIGGADPERPGVVRLFGAGAGQMDRVASCEIACRKAGPLARGAIAASDAFFPFSDGPTLLVESGVTMLVHPGGSKRDGDTFALCTQRGVTCMTTGMRHFRH